jgi:hypothetical protein
MNQLYLKYEYSHSILNQIYVKPKKKKIFIEKKNFFYILIIFLI